MTSCSPGLHSHPMKFISNSSHMKIKIGFIALTFEPRTEVKQKFKLSFLQCNILRPLFKTYYNITISKYKTHDFRTHKTSSELIKHLEPSDIGIWAHNQIININKLDLASENVIQLRSDQHPKRQHCTLSQYPRLSDRSCISRIGGKQRQS